MLIRMKCIMVMYIMLNMVLKKRRKLRNRMKMLWRLIQQFLEAGVVRQREF
jgi:hypothetical protein